MSIEARRSRAELAAETASRLIGVAQLAFAEQGFNAVSLDELALRAGVTRGALHHHFTNKAGLFAAVVRHIDAEITRETAAAWTTSPDCLTGLRNGLHAYLDATLLPSRCRILFQDMTAVMGMDGIDLIMTSGVSDMWQVLNDLVAEGRMTGPDGESLGHLLIGALINLAFWAAEGDAGEGRLQRAHAALDAVLDGLVAPQAVNRTG
jgi:AcrR family transcriptional regulator